MTYLTISSATPLRASILLVAANFFEKRREAVARKQTMLALSSLGNHALRDLAINRTEILSVAYAHPNERKREFAK